MIATRIELTVPKGWQELTDKQLRFVYGLIASDMDVATVKSICFLSFAGVKCECRYDGGYLFRHNRVDFTMTAGEFADALHSLDWIATLPNTPVRLSKIKRHQAADALLHEVAFERYIYIDNLFQIYIRQQNTEILRQMAELLYDHENIVLSDAEAMSIFYWWTALKGFLSKKFRHLFATSSNDENLLGSSHQSLGEELQSAMNAQIRALTKGDITKEKEILAMDTWRALAELDAQARDYEEQQKAMKK